MGSLREGGLRIWKGRIEGPEGGPCVGRKGQIGAQIEGGSPERGANRRAFPRKGVCHARVMESITHKGISVYLGRGHFFF